MTRPAVHPFDLATMMSPSRSRCFYLLSCVLLLGRTTSFTRDAVASFRPNSKPRRSLAASSSVPNLFSDELSATLAEEVQKRVEFSCVPEPVVQFVLTQAIQRMSSDLSSDTILKVQEMLDDESTESTYDDMPEADRNALADQVAEELNAKIDMPMLSEEQELEILQQIMRVVFTVLTTSDGEARKQMIQTSLELSRDLLGSKESRDKLVKAINAAVNIPILRESQEEAILTTAVTICADTLQVLLPPEIIETLKGESPSGLLKMKEYLITTVNERIDLAGLDEKQERALIETMVGILIDTYVDDIEAEFLLLTHDEQREKLEERRATLNREVELSRKRFEREQKTLEAQLERVKMRLQSMSINERSKRAKSESSDQGNERERLPSSVKVSMNTSPENA